MVRLDFKTGTFYLGDCFEVMAALEAGSVDMVLNDPPYGTTACAWDSVLDLSQMWAAYWRLLKQNGPAVMTAAQPFTSALVTSQIKKFKHEWFWVKNRKTGNMLAKTQPLRCVESVLVFGQNTPAYNPQRGPRTKHGGTRTPVSHSPVFGGEKTQKKEYLRPEFETPNQVLPFDTERGFHPTQKPVALFEYLIRTYTNPGELVLDNTAGSGTTAIAAIQSGRRWICIERDEGYFEKAIARVWEAEAAL